MATVASSMRPMVTFADALPTRRSSSSSSSNGDANAAAAREKERQAKSTNGCPVYGCVLLPRDIFYDKLSQRALESLREAKEEEEAKQHAEGGGVSDSVSTGTTSSTTSEQAAQSALTEMLMAGDDDMATLTLIGYKGGDPNEQINQDRAFVISPYKFCDDEEDDDADAAAAAVVANQQQPPPQQPQRLMGVFDGHAHLGERVSEYSVQQVPKLLASKLNEYRAAIRDVSQDTTTIIERCLEETFEEIDQRAPAYPSGGCTATVVLQLGHMVFVANAGDSVSFLVVHKPSTNETEVVYMTREDKPDLPDERERVERMGGRVYIPDRPGSTPRVIYFDKSTGSQSGLAMSRSIGDWDAGRVGVIPNPIVNVIDLNDIVQQYSLQHEKDDVHIFAVSASDGMMDFLDTDTISTVMAAALFEDDSDHPLTACERLISIAAASWQRAKEGRYRDDIAIAVSKLRTPPAPAASTSSNKQTTTAKQEEL